MKSFLLLLILSFAANAQTTNINGRLKVNSTTKGSQPCPVMTNVQMLSIASPDHGDCVFNYDLKALHTWNAFPGEWTMSGSGGGLSEWVTGTGYEIDDIIHTSNRIFKALTNHTSGTFATDLAANEWIEISDELLSKNQIDSSSVRVKEIQVPHKQFTTTATGKVLQETGNKNRLENPGFEAATVNSGWNCSVTSTATCTPTANTSTPIEGKKSVSYTCTGGASGGVCTIYQDVATSYAVQGLASIFADSDTATGVKVFSRVNGTNSLSVNVATLDAGLFKVPVILGTTSTGVASEITVAASQTINVLLDEGFVGAVDLKQDVDQSRIAGASYFAGTASCAWPRTSTTLGAFTADTDCPGPTITDSSMGSWQTTDSNLPRQTITSLPAGKYKVTFTFSNYNSVAGQGSTFAITDGVTTCPSNSGDESTNGGFTSVTCIFNYSSSGDRAFELFTHSASGSVTIDNGVASGFNRQTKLFLEYFGSGSVYSSTNADTDWASCGHTTSSFTGFGTVTNIETQCKRQGGDLLMKGKFTSGAPTGVEARVGLALNGIALTSKGISVIPSVQLAGSFGRNAASGTYFNNSTLIEPSVAYLTIGQQSSTENIITKALGNALTVNGSIVSFDARIPIAGWENSNVIIANLSGLESCTDSYECEDTFSAKISSSCTVSDENIDWINGNCTLSSTSNCACTTNSGIFTILPNFSSTSQSTSGEVDRNISIHTASISSGVVSFQSRARNGANVDTATPISISVQKQGADYIGKTAKAVASDQNVRSIGSVGVDIQSVYFAQGAACTTGNCTINNQIGSKITSVSWASTGCYRVNGIDGTKYNCSVDASVTGNSFSLGTHFRATSTSTYATVCFGSALSTNADVLNASVNCIGIP